MGYESAHRLTYGVQNFLSWTLHQLNTGYPTKPKQGLTAIFIIKSTKLAKGYCKSLIVSKVVLDLQQNLFSIWLPVSCTSNRNLASSCPELNSAMVPQETKKI